MSYPWNDIIESNFWDPSGKGKEVKVVMSLKDMLENPAQQSYSSILRNCSIAIALMQRENWSVKQRESFEAEMGKCSRSIAAMLNELEKR